MDKNGNFQQLTVDLCSLLDEIERAADGLVDDHDYSTEVHELLRLRFALFEKHGFTVEFLGPCEVGTA